MSNAGKYSFTYNSGVTYIDIDTVLDASSNPSSTRLSNFAINGNDLYKYYTGYGTTSFINFGNTGFISSGVDIGSLFEYNLINNTTTTCGYIQKPFNGYTANDTIKGTALIITSSGNVAFNKSIGNCDIYMIGGGGGGGSSGISNNYNAGGGGGGGGYYQMLNVTENITTINCTIGASGNGASNSQIAGTNGGNTIIRMYNGNTNLGDVTVYGGGGGGSGKNWGLLGGNGGGAGSYSTGAPIPGSGKPETITGTLFNADDGYGNYRGGYGQDENSDNGAGGSGGGCGINGIGGDGAAPGGAGLVLPFYINSPKSTTYNVYFDGGGGGGSSKTGSGGAGGGNAGDGGKNPNPGNSALTGESGNKYYSGGGGGGASSRSNASGGNGAKGAIVIIIRDTAVVK
jgi:hypothetical protein